MLFSNCALLLAVLFQLKNPLFPVTITKHQLRKAKLDLLVFRLASLDPLLEQVFIVAVCPGAQCEDSFVGELASVGVDEHGHQAVLFARQLVDQLHDLVHNLLVKKTTRKRSCH